MLERGNNLNNLEVRMETEIIVRCRNCLTEIILDTWSEIVYCPFCDCEVFIEELEREINVECES